VLGVEKLSIDSQNKKLPRGKADTAPRHRTVTEEKLSVIISEALS